MKFSKTNIRFQILARELTTKGPKGGGKLERGLGLIVAEKKDAIKVKAVFIADAGYAAMSAPALISSTFTTPSTGAENLIKLQLLIIPAHHAFNLSKSQ